MERQRFRCLQGGGRCGRRAGCRRRGAAGWCRCGRFRCRRASCRGSRSRGNGCIGRRWSGCGWHGRGCGRRDQRLAFTARTYREAGEGKLARTPGPQQLCLRHLLVVADISGVGRIVEYEILPLNTHQHHIVVGIRVAAQMVGQQREIGLDQQRASRQQLLSDLLWSPSPEPLVLLRAVG